MLSAERVVDVVLVVVPPEAVDNPEFQLPRHANEDVMVADGLWLGPQRLQDRIFDALEEPGENTPRPYRQFGALYAFHKLLSTEGQGARLAFDGDRQLARCIALSRLIRPTSVGLEYSARLIERNRHAPEIIPSHIRGLSAHAFVLRESDDWLRDDDVITLAELLRVFDATTLTERVARALWYHEFLSWMHFIDVRWPLAVTALEALIHTDEGERPARLRMGSTAQFVQRLSLCRQFIPTLTWDEDALQEIYDRRSGLVHGTAQPIQQLLPDDLGLAHMTEAGLRAMLLEALFNPRVMAMFASDASIRDSLDQ